MNVLDLFSGGGGFSLGLERAGMRTVAFCEADPRCRETLRKHWPGIPIFGDVRNLGQNDVQEPVDVVCGGYPCQPFSTAGKRAGSSDDRHLWPEMLRVIQEFRPRFVIAENVAGHITMGLDDVLSDLEKANYAWWAFVIPACAVGHRQRRDRVWILADSMQGNEEMAREFSGSWGQPEQIPWDVACYEESEPGMVAMADGIPIEMGELGIYGNAVVPQIVEIIGRAIMKARTEVATA